MENVLVALRRLIAGQVYVSERMQSKLFRSSRRRGDNLVGSPLERLTDRELEVFRLIGQGLGTKQIANLLHLSSSTVESHRARIKQKFDLKNAIELLRHAVKWVETERVDHQPDDETES